MNPITQKLQADKLIRMALEEDITSEDVSTNAVMPDYKKGKVQLLCKQDGVICGLGVFLRTFELLDDGGIFCPRRRRGEKRSAFSGSDGRYPRAAFG